MYKSTHFTCAIPIIRKTDTVHCIYEWQLDKWHASSPSLCPTDFVASKNSSQDFPSTQSPGISEKYHHFQFFQLFTCVPVASSLHLRHMWRPKVPPQHIPSPRSALRSSPPRGSGDNPPDAPSIRDPARYSCAGPHIRRATPGGPSCWWVP